MSSKNLFDLSGRVAVVTGGNGGIIRGIALGLAQAGSAVAVVARNEEKNQRVVDELEARGVPALAVKADLTDREQLPSDAFGRVQVLVTLFFIGGASLVFWEMRHRSPIVNFRPLGERNFAFSALIIFLAYAVLYGTSTLLPALLETLFGYDAFHAGLVMSPSGVAAVLALIVVGALLGRRVDARWLIAAGLLILAAGNFWMSQLNLDISPWQAVWPRVVMIAGLSMIFAPLNVAAYLYIPLALRGAAVGLFALLRNEGGSFGTSMGQTIVERRAIFHALRLNENLDRLNPALRSYFGQVQPGLLQQTGDPAASHRMALQSLEDLREQQSSSLAYFDAFLIFAVVAVVLAFLVLLMKRSVTEKGAHAAAE